MNKLEIGTEQLRAFKNPEPFHIEEEERDGIWINNVFGINKEGQLPARFLSGFLGTFSLVKTIQEASDGRIQPQVRIFRPVEISKHINGISVPDAERQVQQGNDMLTTFAENFFPDVPFFIEEDLPISEKSLSVLHEVSQHIEQQCDGNIISAVKDSGRKRGGEQGADNALMYVAHHPFGWSDTHHPSIFMKTPPGTVINTLPPSEGRYTAIRENINNAIRDIPEVVVFNGTRQQLTINMCGTPHYISVESTEGLPLEPTLDEIASVSTQEVLDVMQGRFKAEKDSRTADNLRRATADFRNLVVFMAGMNADSKNADNLAKAMAEWKKKPPKLSGSDVLREATFDQLVRKAA